MFKWIALTVATLGIASLTYCFWPRAHIEDHKLVTPSGRVFDVNGDAIFEPSQAEFQAHMRTLMASDAIPFVPTPAPPNETEEQRRYRELMNYARSVGGTTK